jgi:hypothetical protein
MDRLARAVLALGLILASAVTSFASGDVEDSNQIIGSGSIRTEDREVPPFNAVELEGSGNLTIRRGAPGLVRIETDDNLLPLVKTEVVGGVLHLGLIPGAPVNRITRMEFTVVTPKVTAITLSGSGNVRSAGALRGQSLAVNIEGSGNILCDAQAESLQAAIHGSGGIYVRGSAERVSISILGSGSVRAQDLHSTRADVKISGSGDALVFATDALDVVLSGSGSVHYGGGARPTVHSTGSGSASAY